MKDLRFNKFDKIIYKLRWCIIKGVKIINQDKYIHLYKKLLFDYGMKIDPNDLGYIDPSAFFDNYDYSFITLGKNVTISRDVLLLNHDFSINKALICMKEKRQGYFLKRIDIGNNCFIGARVILLPGTKIGDNCIIGAGAVVKGIIPENSVVAGNPARIICQIDEFGRKHLDKDDFVSI